MLFSLYPLYFSQAIVAQTVVAIEISVDVSDVSLGIFSVQKFSTESRESV